MSDILYEKDIVAWSGQQAELLRRRSANALDWDNLAEEIEDVGKSQTQRVASLLVQALRHMLKAIAWPDHRDAPTWRADAIDFRRQARRRFTPSMRKDLDIRDLYADALAATPKTMDGLPPQCELPPTCPWALDHLLSDDELSP